MTKRIIVERFLYAFLFVILAGSIALFFTQHSFAEGWEIYHNVYFGILLVYTWFVFILLFIGDMRKKKTFANPAVSADPKIAVIVPCYNEQPDLLEKALRSVIEARGNKEIVVIDDGSTNDESKRLLLRFADEHGVQVHFFERNQGKRHALYHAVSKMLGDAELVVTIDSDTVLDKDALVEIAKPFADPKIGATTGDVRLLNENQNVLTRMVGAYYWIGLNIYKRAQSAVGMVVCCSGCLAAYRASLLKEVIEEFVNQTFFGEQCTHSEDRHLTNLILKKRYHVKYIPESICYTETPATVRGFLKQQQRWKRGYIRESIYTLTYAWKTRPLLFLEILLVDLTIPFFTFGLMMALVVTVFTSPMTFLTTILPAWIIFMFVRYIHILFYAKRKIPGLFVYILFYEAFLYWQNIYALFTVRNKKWITR